MTKSIHKSLSVSENNRVINHFGEDVYLKSCYINGKIAGMTECCFANDPCTEHRIKSRLSKTEEKETFSVEGIDLTSEDIIDALFTYAAKWSEIHGGTALVTGGPHFIQMPNDLKNNYYVAIKITGRIPSAPNKTEEEHERD